MVSSSYEDDDFIDENDQLDSSEEDTSINEPRVMEDRDSYEEIETSNGGKMAEEVEGLSLAHLQEDIKKGKAAKQQIGENARDILTSLSFVNPLSKLY